MARLIQKSGYIQGGRAARYMEYIAKRDGVEVLQSTEPVTKKQMQFLTKLLKDFPDAKELFEYADYLQTPNRGTASAFIAAALDTHLHEERIHGLHRQPAPGGKARRSRAIQCGGCYGSQGGKE